MLKPAGSDKVIKHNKTDNREFMRKKKIAFEAYHSLPSITVFPELKQDSHIFLTAIILFLSGA